MTNIVPFRKMPVTIRRTEDPLGTADVADELKAGVDSGKIRSILSMVEYEDGNFEVIQSGSVDALRLLGSLQFAQFDTYLEIKAEAEPAT